MAICTIYFYSESLSPAQEHMIQNEVAILRRVKHPNIVLLIEEMDTYSELYLVMELVKVCTTASCHFNAPVQT